MQYQSLPMQHALRRRQWCTQARLSSDSGGSLQLNEFKQREATLTQLHLHRETHHEGIDFSPSTCAISSPRKFLSVESPAQKLSKQTSRCLKKSFNFFRNQWYIILIDIMRSVEGRILGDTGLLPVEKQGEQWGQFPFSIYALFHEDQGVVLLAS